MILMNVFRWGNGCQYWDQNNYSSGSVVWAGGPDGLPTAETRQPDTASDSYYWPNYPDFVFMLLYVMYGVTVE